MTSETGRQLILHLKLLLLSYWKTPNIIREPPMSARARLLSHLLFTVFYICLLFQFDFWFALFFYGRNQKPLRLVMITNNL